MWFSNQETVPSHKRYMLYDGKPLPPYLTQTERIRFIRALYQLWEIILLDHENRKKKTETSLFRDIMTINDPAMIDSPGNLNFIQDKQVLQIRAADPGLMSNIAHRYRSLSSIFLGVIGCNVVPVLSRIMATVGWFRFGITIMGNLKKRLLGEEMGLPIQNPDVWYDTDDEME